METALILSFLFVLGAVLGAMTNCFVDAHCWTPRYRSPWRVLPAGNRFSKRWFDFLPILGWLFLRRIGSRLEAAPESQRLPGLETRNFWIRPFCVELMAAVGLPLLYLWEVSWQMLLPLDVVPESSNVLVARFAVHVLLFGFLLAASLIDIDDMIIPDCLTVPGTILGLLLAACVPWTLLPATETQVQVVMGPQVGGQNPMAGARIVHGVVPEVVPLNLCSPNPIKGPWLDPLGVPVAVLSGALWSFWCFAMLHRVWYPQLPFRKAAAIFCRRLRRSPATKWYLAAMLLGWVGVGVAVCLPWIFTFEELGLLTALVGMAAGMAMIWSVRIIGRLVLGREAMGFGDVTLMGMIGAFVGWQSCILIFFLAPFAGLVLGILNAVSGRGREFPYGPFLCLATAALVVFWSPIWNYVTPVFELGGLVVAVMLLCLVMLGVLLGLWRWIRNRLFSGCEN